eukprot:scaffold62481_cov74-Phaeocystis_antarctica.AAC.1
MDVVWGDTFTSSYLDPFPDSLSWVLVVEMQSRASRKDRRRGHDVVPRSGPPQAASVARGGPLRGSWRAATRYAAAPKPHVATTWCRYAAQVSHTRPKLFYETQAPHLLPGLRAGGGHLLVGYPPFKAHALHVVAVTKMQLLQRWVAATTQMANVQAEPVQRPQPA